MYLKQYELLKLHKLTKNQYYLNPQGKNTFTQRCIQNPVKHLRWNFVCKNRKRKNSQNSYNANPGPSDFF